MDKSDKTLGRRDFIRVLGGTVVAAGVAGCGEADSPNPPTAAPGASAAAGSTAPVGPVTPPGVPPSAAASTPAVPDTSAANSGGAQPATPPASGPAAASPGAPPAQQPMTASSAKPANPTTPATTTPMTGPSAPTAPMTAPSNGKAKVVIIKAATREEGINQAIAMFGGLGFVAGRDVVIKPNFNSQYEFPATTHDDTIRTVVKGLKGANAGKITIGESSGATTGSATPTATVVQMKNTMALVGELGIEFLSYDTAGVEFETFNFDGMTWSGGLAIPKLMRSDRVKILLPCCKTHSLADYTFSIKIAAGLPPRSRRGLISDMHTNLQEKVADIGKGFEPDLIVMDALKCFIDGGPDSGTVREPGLIVVSNDRIALDAVGVAILKNAGSTSAPIRGKIFQTRQLVRAVEIGLTKTKNPDGIELVGNDDATISKLRSILDVG